MSAKHTPGLTREQVFAIADKYGAFEFGDAQGDKRQAFAADLIEAHERIRAAAPALLEALQSALNVLYATGAQSEANAARAAIAAATGEQP